MIGGDFAMSIRFWERHLQVLYRKMAIYSGL